MVDTSAGTRLRFETAATVVGVVLRARPLQLQGLPQTASPVVDLVIDGQLVETSQPIDGDPLVFDGKNGCPAPGPSATCLVMLSGLNSASKVVKLWIPHGSLTEVVSVVADNDVQPVSPSGAPRWVHHGSSISHGLEVTRPTERWPALVALSRGLDLVDLSFAGSAVLDQFVARTIRDTKADVISLELCINLVNANAISLRAFKSAVHGLLDTIRDGHPDAPLLIISPTSCPAHEDVPGPTDFDAETGVFRSVAVPPFSAEALTLSRIRTALRKTVRSRSHSGDPMHYLDGQKLLSRADVDAGVLVDGLHPNRSGHRLISERADGDFRTLLHPSEPRVTAAIPSHQDAPLARRMPATDPSSR